MFIIVIDGIYIAKNRNKDYIDASYKLIVKVNDVIYYLFKDLEDINLKKSIFIGEVEKSYYSGSKSVDEGNENISTNVFPKGSKIYLHDETSIIVGTNSWVAYVWGE